MGTLINKILEHSDGKLKSNVIIFISSFCTLLFSWVILFGFGGAICLAIGLTFAILSLICSVFSGILTVILYIDWIENG